MANFKANFRKPTGPPYGNAYGKLAEAEPLIYYLDGHTLLIDSGSDTYSNQANAVDGSESTFAAANASTLATNIIIRGSNAPASGPAILKVEFKVVTDHNLFGTSPSVFNEFSVGEPGHVWTSQDTLDWTEFPASAVSGGAWTWPLLQNTTSVNLQASCGFNVLTSSVSLAGIFLRVTT